MNTRKSNLFRPALENLEGRELMTAGLDAVLHAPLPLSMDAAHMRVIEPATTQHPALDKGQLVNPYSTSQYSAFTVTNNTRFNLTFSVRWDVQSTEWGSGTWTSWQTYSLKPGYRETFYYSAVVSDGLSLWSSPIVSGESAQLYFAPSTTSSHSQTDNLSSSVVNGMPVAGSGTQYEFLPTSSTTLNIYVG